MLLYHNYYVGARQVSRLRRQIRQAKASRACIFSYIDISTTQNNQRTMISPLLVCPQTTPSPSLYCLQPSNYCLNVPLYREYRAIFNCHLDRFTSHHRRGASSRGNESTPAYLLDALSNDDGRIIDIHFRLEIVDHSS